MRQKANSLRKNPSELPKKSIRIVNNPKAFYHFSILSARLVCDNRSIFRNEIDFQFWLRTFSAESARVIKPDC